MWLLQISMSCKNKTVLLFLWTFRIVRDSLLSMRNSQEGDKKWYFFFEVHSLTAMLRQLLMNCSCLAINALGRIKITNNILRNSAISIAVHIYQVILPRRVHFSNNRDFGVLERIVNWGKCLNYLTHNKIGWEF